MSRYFAFILAGSFDDQFADSDVVVYGRVLSSKLVLRTKSGSAHKVLQRQRLFRKAGDRVEPKRRQAHRTLRELLCRIDHLPCMSAPGN